MPISMLEGGGLKMDDKSRRSLIPFQIIFKRIIESCQATLKMKKMLSLQTKKSIENGRASNMGRDQCEQKNLVSAILSYRIKLLYKLLEKRLQNNLLVFF